MFYIAFSPVYAHPLPEGHRFPMLKYELIPEQLLYEGTCTPANFHEPAPVNDDWVLGVHTSTYVDPVEDAQCAGSHGTPHRVSADN